MNGNVFEDLEKGNQPQKRVRPGAVEGYQYKDAKPTGNPNLDRIRTFLKTEINPNINGSSDQTWYSVDVGSNQKEGRFYALKSHLGQSKQKTIKKAYSVEDLVTYFFGPVSKDDFNCFNLNVEQWVFQRQWEQRKMIWQRMYNVSTWMMHINGGKK